MSGLLAVSSTTTARALAKLEELAELLVEHRQSARRSVGRGLASNAGYAILFAALFQAKAEERFAEAAGRELQDAAGFADVPSRGLFSGLAGLRAAAAYAEKLWPKFGRLAAQCDSYIGAELSTIPEVVEMDTYDLISGWAGTRAALALEGGCNPDMYVESLLALFDSGEGRWRTRNRFFPDRASRNIIGVAHGVVGPLTIIALTTKPDPATVARVVVHARKVAELAITENNAVGWPQWIGHNEIYRPMTTWCYGSAGIAAALFAVGKWARDEWLCEVAISSLASIDHRSAAALPDAALCHGIMGTVACYASVAANSSGHAFEVAIDDLVNLAIDRLAAEGNSITVRSNNDSRLAFGELDGLAGVCLMLATLLYDIDSSWMRLHGLLPLPHSSKSGCT